MARKIRKKGVWKPFIIGLSLLLFVVLSGLFIGIFFSMQKAVETEMLSRARGIYDSIVLARSWNAHYDGVYVEKKPGVESNPYLPNPDMQGMDGKWYTKKNPALMTREISQMAETRGSFRFHITSLRAINPGNAPDKVEEQALRDFERGVKEVYLKERENGSISFRYMGPLYVEQKCLRCHGKQGYRVGDVRGGISVSFNIDAVEKTVSLNRMLTLVVFVVATAAILAIVYSMIFRLYRKLACAEECIRQTAITDELTGLRNRRYLMDKLKEQAARAARYDESACLIMFDLDDFKQVNDLYGHDVGDRVLRMTGEVVRECCRKMDTAARYGGEEFALLLPRSDPEGAFAVAEKLRATLECRTLLLEGGEALHVTASFGVACMARGGATDVVEHLIKRTDQALYQAKKNGRNQVRVADGATNSVLEAVARA